MCPSPQSIARSVEIVNSQGLHARPVMRFVDVARTFRSVIRVDKGDSEVVDGKSPMEMMLLAAPKGTVLRIEAAGEDAQEAVDELVRVVQSGFDES